MRKSIIASIILFLIIVFVLLGLYLFVYSSRPKTVRLGYLRADLHQLAVYVAIEKKWFEEEGIKLSVSQFINGNEEMDAFMAGALDIGYLGTAPASVKRINAGAPITLVAGVNVEGSAIVVRKNQGISSLLDLKGKTVAVPGFGNVQHFLLLMALEKAGLTEKDVAITRIPFSDMEDALRAGEIDAFIVWEPWASAAVEHGVGDILITSDKIWRQHPCCVVAVDNGFLRENKEIVKKIIEIHIKATHYISNPQNHDEIVKIASKYCNLPGQVIEEAMKHITYVSSLNVDGIKTYVSKLVEYGYIEEEKVPEDLKGFMETFVSTEFLKGS